jgi:hypothetical protein
MSKPISKINGPLPNNYFVASAIVRDGKGNLFKFSYQRVCAGQKWVASYPAYLSDGRIVGWDKIREDSKWH